MQRLELLLLTKQKAVGMPGPSLLMRSCTVVSAPGIAALLLHCAAMHD